METPWILPVPPILPERYIQHYELGFLTVSCHPWPDDEDLR